MQERQPDLSKLHPEVRRLWVLVHQRHRQKHGELQLPLRSNPGIYAPEAQPNPRRLGVGPEFTRHLGPIADDPLFWSGSGRSRRQVDPQIARDLEAQRAMLTSSPSWAPRLLDRGLAGPRDGAAWIPLGNPANPRLRKEWEQREGRQWPRDPKTGRNYDVAHGKAIADGGTNTLDNIGPMHPDDHRAQHMRDGDFSRWAKRRGRNGGGPKGGGSSTKAMGPLGMLLNLLGIASGRIRTDTPDNFWSDMIGVPSLEDERDAFEQRQRSIDPNWRPGDPWVT